MHAQRRLTGAAAAFANLWREWKRSTSAVERVMVLYGTPAFEINVSSLLDGDVT